MSELTWNLFLSVLTLLLTKEMYNLSVKVSILRFYCFLGDDNTLYIYVFRYTYIYKLRTFELFMNVYVFLKNKMHLFG